MKLETLYKKDRNTGTIREWSVYVEGNKISVVHGIKDGKMQVKEIFAKGKNAGKANATTDEQQALNEAKSKWTEQVERECYTVWDDIDKPSLYLQPMLALDATKVGHRVDFSRAVGQRKLDGVRVIWRPDLKKLQSRKGTFYDAPMHIIDQLMDVEENLDGELYCHGLPLNEILSASRKYNSNTERLNFHAFDIADWHTSFGERHSDLTDEFEEKGLHARGNLVLEVFEELPHKEALIPMHNRFVQEGYEGLMIRHIDGLYDFGGRSEDLFKYKVFKEGEFLITRVREDNDGGAVLELVTKDGHPFASRPRGTLEYRMGLLEGLCVGKRATVRYFTMTSTETPVPQFPVVVAIEDQK